MRRRCLVPTPGYDVPLMSLRIAFDLDGVLAGFDSALEAIDLKLFGVPAAARPRPVSSGEAGASDTDPEEVALHPPADWRFDRIWQEVSSTPDFWTTLPPLDASAVARIHELAGRYAWEVFFVTQRPATAGETVQRQTQRWLVHHGFELPTVLVLRGSRGKVAEALHLDFLVDDSLRNCVDILSESQTQPLLVTREEHTTTIQDARHLGIRVVHSVSEALLYLEGQEHVRQAPALLGRISKLFSN